MVVSDMLEAILRKDRAIVFGGLALVIVLSWAYILAGAGVGMSAFDMSAPPSVTGDAPTTEPMAPASPDMAPSNTRDSKPAIGDMMAPVTWNAAYATLMFFMWWIMMIAMMLPSAAPMILLFAAINRKQRERDAPYVPTAIFALGYVVVWGAFGLVAVGLQWGLERAELLSMMMRTTSHLLGGGLLVAAGVWQLTPLKHACLRHCRSPLFFITHHWRRGYAGAFRMGLEHGAFCLGCCWFLMGLLFFGGVMNLYWIIGLAAYILIEKTVPHGHWVGNVIGVLLAAWGIWLIATAF